MLAALAAVAAVLLPAAPAAAHNALRSADPAQEARLTTAPRAVTLEFVEALKPTFTTIVLTDSGNQKVPAGEPVIAGAKVTLAVTGTLPNGSYTVAYRVVSADGHPVQGSYRFAVADPAAPTTAAAPAASAPSTPSPTVAAARSSAGHGPGPLMVAGGVLAAVALGAVVVARRRRG